MQFQVILSHYRGFGPYDGERDALAACGADLFVAYAGPETVAWDVLHRCDVLLNIGWRVPAELMDRMPKCRLVVIYGIGTDAVDLKAATARGIVVSNIPLAGVDDVANHAMALLLASVRRIVKLDSAIRSGEYDWELLRPAHNLRGKVLGLVAFGNTARALAVKAAAAFGMRVMAYAPTVDPDLAKRYEVRLAALDEVVREADVLSVHVPLTPVSRGMIGEAQLRLMKPTAHLIATSRGGVVDETALVRALSEGWIAGAALDVQAHEPVLRGDPLLEAPNLILTPHCAGVSEESFADYKRLAVDAACRVLAGHWPRWTVNREVKPRIPLTEPGEAPATEGQHGEMH